ncbi:unnamed protein product [Rotaria socialis]|nr:unnamed protein product [Rotaria socialis]
MELKIYTDYNELVKAINIGELYERSLSIRYCYPHILELKSEKSIMNQDEQKKLIEHLPAEMQRLILFSMIEIHMKYVKWSHQSHFHLEKSTLLHNSNDEEFDSDTSINNQQYEFDKLEILARQRKWALENTEEKLVDQYLVANSNGHDYHLDRWRTFSRDDIIGYRENLLK